MALAAVAKGKKRARNIVESSSESEHDSNEEKLVLRVPARPTSALKRSKSRAETRSCPICNEAIPLRLLGKHAELERGRVENIIKHIGSEEPFYDDRDEPGPSSRGRRSALKARQSITPRNNGTLDDISKTLQSIKRRRKQRHGKLKEMLREEEENYSRRDPWSRGTIGGQIVCPICAETVRGDQGVLEAHVDVCVANESRRLEEVRQDELAAQQFEDEWEEGPVGEGSGQYVGDLPGTGFHTRNRHSEDVDDDIDIDGDDQAVYGEYQFTEGDILPIVEKGRPGDDAEVEVDVDGEAVAASDSPQHVEGLGERKSPPGQVKDEMKDEQFARIQIAICNAKKKGNMSALVTALEAKVDLLETSEAPSNLPTCRICLDPYDEPTLSTGCWHTCCRECWLRCLGSTMQCPICKRITVPGDLRRIYL